MRTPKDLKDFVDRLERAGELRRIRAEVDPSLEITEIATRVVREGGPALLFERVKGSPWPLAINVFASAKRLECALGRSPEEIGGEFRALLEDVNPPNVAALWKHRRLLWRARNLRVRRVRRAASQQVSEEPDLDRLPILTCWPADGGRFITFPLVVTQKPGGRERNIGLYRMHVYSARETGLHWQIQKGGGFHHREAELRAEPLEVAVAIGGDPVLAMAGMWPLPEGLDEAVFAGLIRGRRTRMARARTLSMDVPADADFVLEGTVPPGVRRLEGPFGDHYGHYSHAADFPLFQVKRITRRRDPIYLAAVVGRPPQEDMWLGNAVQEMFSPLLALAHPEVRDVWSFYEGGFHTLLGVSVENRYAKEGLKTALGLLGEGTLSLTKLVVLVDGRTDCRKFRSILRAVREGFEPARDFVLIPGTAMDTLDFAGHAPNLGSKMILDATGVLGPAPPSGPVPRGIETGGLPILGQRVLEDALLALRVPRGCVPGSREILERILAREEVRPFKLVALVSDDVDLESDTSLLWGILTRFDPAADAIFRHSSLRGACPVHEGPLGIDSTWKRGYPEPLAMAPEIVDRVTRRWNEYFP